jgi:nucleoside-diphosphate-sugar epimerase
MAAELMEAHVAGKVRVAVARASDFYGEAVLRSTIGEIVFAELLRGRPARAIGNVDLPHTMTYVGDFGRAMVILGEHDAALGQVWHVPSAEPTMTVRQLVERVAGDAGCAPRVTVLKGRLLALVSIFHPMLRELRELRYQVEEPFILDHSKFVSTFGDIATPVDVAIRRTVAWYRRSYRGCQSSPSESSESASAHEETPASTA